MEYRRTELNHQSFFFWAEILSCYFIFPQSQNYSWPSSHFIAHIADWQETQKEVEKVEETLKKPWTYERWNTEELKEHFAEGRTFTKEEKQRIRKKVLELMKHFWEEVHVEMKSMSMDQVLKALKTMGKHPHFPTFVKKLTVLPNEGEHDQDSHPDLELKKDLFSWMTWLKLMEIDDEEVKAYVTRYEIQIQIPDSHVKEHAKELDGLAKVKGSLGKLRDAIDRSEHREQKS